MQRYPTQHSLRHLLDDWSAAPRPVVLALVVCTSGSSYRKAGALALIDEDGLVVGCISGGCLESDLLSHASSLLGSAQCVRRRYDTRTDEDRWFGSQSGCRGEIDVLLWPSIGPEHALLQALQLGDAQHRTVFVRDTAPPLAPPISLERPTDLSEWLAIAPPPRALLLGAGPEAPALIGMLRTLGWRLTVIEHRERYLGERLAAADQVLHARPASALSGLDLAPFDVALCATHLYDEDRGCLEVLAASALPRIGLLGPPMRRDELLAELAPDAAASLRKRLEAPIGLPLGAHGPEAVALSIAARLTQWLGHV